MRELHVARGHDCPSSAAVPHGLHRRLRASRQPMPKTIPIDGLPPGALKSQQRVNRATFIGA